MHDCVASGLAVRVVAMSDTPSADITSIDAISASCARITMPPIVMR